MSCGNYQIKNGSTLITESMCVSTELSGSCIINMNILVREKWLACCNSKCREKVLAFVSYSAHNLCWWNPHATDISLVSWKVRFRNTNTWRRAEALCTLTRRALVCNPVTKLCCNFHGSHMGPWEITLGNSISAQPDLKTATVAISLLSCITEDHLRREETHSRHINPGCWDWQWIRNPKKPRALMGGCKITAGK